MEAGTGDFAEKAGGEGPPPPDRMGLHGRRLPFPVGVILAVTILKGCLYAWAIPYGRAPDEPSHFNYVMHLRRTGRMPVHYFPGYESRFGRAHPHPPDPPDPAAGSLGHVNTDCSFNPPLYYLTCAAVVWASGAKTTAAVVICRLVSIALVTATVYVFFLIARTLFPDDPWLILGIPLAASFHPQFTFIGSVINNDNLVNLIAAALCLLWVRSTVDCATPSRAARMGVLTGLWFLGKASFALAAFTSAMVLAVAVIRERQGLRRGGLLFGAYGLAAAAVGFPLGVRNLVIYGDIAGLADMVSYFGEGSAFHSSLAGMVLGGVGEMPSAWSVAVFQSFWGNFDWLLLPLPGWIYLLLLAALGIGAVGTVRHLVRRRQRSETRALLLLIVSALANLGMMAVYCYYFIYQPQGRYLFPSLFAITAVICVGLSSLSAGRRGRDAVLACTVGAFGLLNLYSLLGIILPHYR